MERSEAKAIIEKIINICIDYADCDNCPFQNIITEFEECPFSGAPMDWTKIDAN